MSQDEKVVDLPNKKGIDFNVFIMDDQGKPLTDEQDDEDSKAVRLGDVVVRSLRFAPDSMEVNESEKWNRFKLSKKIQGKIADEDYPTLTTLNKKQKERILKVVAQVYQIFVFGQVKELVFGIDALDEEDEDTSD